MNNKRIRMDIILGIPHSQVHHTLLNEVADFYVKKYRPFQQVARYHSLMDFGHSKVMNF